VAVVIEGASPSETGSGQQVAAGEETIDVAEYYGSEDIVRAALVRYIQLKHSTLRVLERWTPSELKNTLEGFASRYKALRQRLPGVRLAGKLELWFVTNRPVSESFVETIEDAARDNAARHPAELIKLEGFVGLTGAPLSDFCK